MQSGTLVAGRYRLDERIAAGGMGEVWKGTDTRLGRTVAIKILHAGLSSNDKFRTRFQLEARAVAALQSPGIVALYDYGEETNDDGEVSYLIMELVRGRSLAEILRDRGTLPPAEVMSIVAAAADALETAHRHDIIHRDVKPANLLVDEETGAAKIVDFGISAARGASGLTETGTVMGTLAYASPEQLNGAELTGASDLYSLGIVAYEALMGRPPFVSDTPVAVMNGHMTQAPPPLSREIPAGVAQVVLQALQKDPRARYTSAAEMARSAREGRVVTGGIPVAPTTPPDGQQAQYFGSDQTALLGAGLAGGGNTAEQPTGAMAQEEEKRSAAPWIITASVVVILALIGLLIWLDDRNGTPGQIKTPEPSTSSVQTSESPSPTEEESTEDDDDDSNWEPSTEEETSETPSETPSTPDTETSSPDSETSSPDTETSQPDDETTPPDNTGSPTTEASDNP
ncbi:serine/threonine-protein kinase [Glycomyces luteolus]|uniref:non-specific serine/threonine protein kinase n=1 Tax=Glycomyces luteolus TaxID=2670330 RepID=A0A9X3P8C8_9ACTN|nr:serine/threonine-protein kinase [Glycomyces luteolus]MDA1359979.1 serine/threonine-protein kinase [Glycomyces luteolus]